ncbi:hypothetical protein TIFTF001_045643 [Ficus carica]|uniref:NB-ARC domain-containing protein n=1 Tax=Ficus carica TaxID=3494 RepID=A0AA87ZA76_FICCA|nr:hypothetical protein TIFTF001_045643 [Ficus carica]
MSVVGCLVTIGGAILRPVCDCVFAPVRHQLEYIFSYKDKIKNLENQVRKLDDKINMIQSDTELAKNEGNAIKEYVQDWQKDATSKFKEAKDFLEPDPDHTRARCSCRRPLPNLALRRRLSKEAKEMAEEIEHVIGKANDFGKDISFRPAVQHSFEQKDFEKFETRDETLREMMEALRNPEVRMIGLCGFGGMGKTMLVKEVARLAKEGNQFSRQIMVVVSQNLDIERIQQQIADQLGLKFEKEHKTSRAKLLEDSLEKEQKILIILDDVWKDQLDDLSKVGIRFKDDSKESKIILTSRFQEVCRAMGADDKTTLEIKGLDNGEAMDLFNRIVGDVVDGEKSEFRSIATEVIGECGGLPLAIVTIASALKINKSLSFWGDALLQLKQWSPESIIYGKMYNCFKAVYNELGNEAKENFEELYAISVPGGGGFNDDQLPERLACPRLKFLMLRTNGGLEITDRFFEETKELKALRLDVKGGKKLASSFRSLQNLKALHLRIWEGGDVDIAIIGELTNLLILDLSASKDLVALPKEIGNLSRLQVLNLSDCCGLKVIEPNVISRLVQLEELYMERFWWETEGLINASLLSIENCDPIEEGCAWAGSAGDGWVLGRLKDNKIVKISTHTSPTKRWFGRVGGG